jgi:hypothetical protein
VKAAEYRVCVRAPEDVRPVEGVDYDQVVTEKLERSPQTVVREVLGEHRPSGGCCRSCATAAARPAPSCTPRTARKHKPARRCSMWTRALDTAEHPGTRLCTPCGAAQELTPMLSRFDHITDSAPGYP